MERSSRRTWWQPVCVLFASRSTSDGDPSNDVVKVDGERSAAGEVQDEDALDGATTNNASPPISASLNGDALLA